ncbi:MAG: YIP1 family protein [Chloroflexota bacterium]|jgi:MFS family permease|nr:YIP1 family protein [Chloroflexota bacterium]
MDQMAGVILNRVIRVAKLDLPVYREITRDANATKEAAVVVAVVALASGIGALSDSFGRVILAVVVAFIGWVIFAAMTYFFGKNIFGTHSTQVNVESLLRTQGYAQAPGVLAFFGFIPVLGWIAALVGGIWALITAIVAIRETLVIGTGRAIIVGIVAAIASGIVSAILSLIFGIGWAF